MDSQIIYALFTACIEAAGILGLDEGLIEQWTGARAKLPEPKVGRHGQIMEWAVDYEEHEPGHRHISHLFALHPGEQIIPHRMPEVGVAARARITSYNVCYTKLLRRSSVALAATPTSGILCGIICSPG